jgi:hypothetical protein
MPWERGRSIARDVRLSYGWNGQPLSDESVASLLGIREADLKPSRSDSVAPVVGLAIRESGDAMRLHFRKRNRAGLRFEAARSMAFRNRQPDESTEVQRAFAAQLLCPIEHLDEFLSGDYTQERIEDAAEHFGISPLAISSQLASGKRRPVHKQPQAQPGCSDYDFKNSLNFLASPGIFYRAGQPVTNRIVRIGQAGH